MKTPLLIEVPKDSPSREQLTSAFKKAFNIYTHRCSAVEPERTWMAILCPRPMTDAEGFEHFANYCRILDEQGLLVEGKSERAAMRKLCENNQIPCYL